jgi:pimeloyl-ACP methyl ester carboxylesterase
LTKQKLELTRLPRETETASKKEQWVLGTPKSALEPLLDHWLESYDWRAEEDVFNSTLPQFRTLIPLPPGRYGGDQKPIRTHFVHKRSTHTNAVPLLFCHSWPGSFVEVQRVIDALADSQDEGELAFHVVCPSIPGFGFSDASEDPDFGVHGAAEVFAGLMKRLGYETWVMCGSGW